MSSDNETILSSSSESTAEHLEHLSARIIDCIRKRDWSNQDWIDYVGENVQVYAPASFLELHGEPATVGRDAYMESYKAFTDMYPEYDCDPISINADVNEQEGTANVWVIMTVTGHPPMVRKESVTILHWVRGCNGWVMVRSVGIRGSQVF